MLNFFFQITTKALAQSTNTDFTSGPTSSLIDYINGLLKWLIPTLGSIALLMFIWAGYLYITSQGNPDKINFAKELVISTLIGILLLFSIRIIITELGLS